MATQKIIKVGNSLAITLPANMVREAGWKAGDELIIEQSPPYEIMVVKPKSKAGKTYLSPEFLDWLDEVSVKYKDAIKELANI